MVNLKRSAKKTLLLCGEYPLPEITGGNIRTMNFVRFFEKRGSVDIAYSALLGGAEAKNAIFSNEYILERRNYPRHFFGRFAALLRGRPYPIRAYSDDSEKLLLSLIESKDYDYILVRYIVNAFYLFNLPTEQRKRIILDFDDVFSDSLYETLFYNTKNLYKRMIRKVNRKILLRHEKRCLDLGVSIFCSEKDKRRTIANENKEFVIPNIYLNKTFENHDFGNGFENRKIILFVGTLAYNPNVEGLKWFIESVYPEFKREFPDSKLLVVGHLGNSSGVDVKKSCQGVEGVELFSNVPDIKEYYKRCGALVVPLLRGAGTRIKILEAALASRPVISTPVGAEGLDLVNGKDLLIFQNAEEFSLRFKEMLVPEKYHCLVNNAKKSVLKNYSNEVFDEAMEKVLNKIR